MKKRLALLVMFLVLVLAGCGEGSNNTGSDGKDNDQTNESKEVSKDESENYANVLEDVLPAVTDGDVELQETSYEFISEHAELFPAKTEEDINQAKSLVDDSITIKHLNKNVAPYLEKVLSFQGTVIAVEEETEDDETISLTHVYDEEGNSYEVLMFKTTGDILEDDEVQFWGSPVGAHSFENISGGFTNSQIFFGSHLEKTN